MLAVSGDPTVTEAHPRPAHSSNVPASCFMGTSFPLIHTRLIGNVQGKWHFIRGVVSVTMVEETGG